MNPNNEPEIVFESEQYSQVRSQQRTTPKLVEWVIRYSGGSIQDEKQANYILVGFSILIIIISGFLVFGGNSNKDRRTIIYQEDVTPTVRATIPKNVLDTLPKRNVK